MAGQLRSYGLRYRLSWRFRLDQRDFEFAKYNQIRVVIQNQRLPLGGTMTEAYSGDSVVNSESSTDSPLKRVKRDHQIYGSQQDWPGN